jgi:periplasmic protein TonB
MNTRAEKHPLGALGRIGFVAGMHVALLFVLARSFGMMPPPDIVRTEGVVIDELNEPEPPPPLPTPDVEYQSQEVFVAQHEVPIDVENDPPQDITPPAGPDIIGGEGGGSGRGVVMPSIVGVQSDPRHPLTQPPYHPADIREGNQGAVEVEVYVLPDGRVGDARIMKSSGFPRMDRATLDEAKRRWRLIPATRDGVPVAQWYPLRVVFKLKTQ